MNFLFEIKVSLCIIKTSKLAKLIPNVKTDFNLPLSDEAIDGASNGLADLQEHYGLDPMDLIKVNTYFMNTYFITKSSLMGVFSHIFVLSK